MTGGSLSAVNGSQYVGYSGAGTFTQSGGTNSNRGLYLGLNTGSSGTYSLSGTGVLSATGEYVGNSSAAGSFQQSGGSNATGASRSAGGKSTGDAAFSITNLPTEVQRRAIPAICDRLENARSFDTMPLVHALLSAASPRAKTQLPSCPFSKGRSWPAW